ncbi:MAG: lysophospholipid acyltransferase family protein [Frankia sp.]
MSDPVYKPVIRVALGLLRTLDLRIDVRGQEHIPAAGGAVVTINHISYLDFVLAGVPFWYSHRRLIRFMAKEAVFRHRFAGPLMRGMKHIPVDRAAGASSYRYAVDALRSGELVGVFPESTISLDFNLAAFKSGAARMAVEAGVPVLPVVIWGSQRVLTKGHRFDRHSARHVPVSITVGAPILPAELGSDPIVATATIAKAMLEQLIDARKHYPEPDRLPAGLPPEPEPEPGADG